jgi:site-specific recombinase XerC
MVKLLSQSEFRKVESILGSIPKKDAAILAILMYCGLRVNELCHICYEDLVFVNQVPIEIHVPASFTKTGYGRRVPVPGVARYLITNYLASTSLAHDPFPGQAALFRGNSSHQYMSTHGVRQLVLRHCVKPLGKKVTPHMLRHTYATMLLKYSNIREVQELLGHKKLSSTQIYTHPNMVDLAKSVDKTFS